MKILHGIRRFFTLSAFRPDPKGDLESELSFHFRQTEEELLAQGFSPAEAREEAHRRFGDLAHYRRELIRIDDRSAARSRRLALSSRRIISGNPTLSNTVMWGKRAKF